jgi:hypothetical protein
VNAKRDKGMCDVCGRHYLVTKAGLIALHLANPAPQRLACPGSGKPPAACPGSGKPPAACPECARSVAWSEQVLARYAAETTAPRSEN